MEAVVEAVSVDLTDGVIQLGWNGQTINIVPARARDLDLQKLFGGIKLALEKLGVKIPDVLLRTYTVSFPPFGSGEVHAEVALSQFPHSTSHQRVAAKGKHELEAWTRAVVAALSTIAFNNRPRGHPI